MKVELMCCYSCLLYAIHSNLASLACFLLFLKLSAQKLFPSQLLIPRKLQQNVIDQINNRNINPHNSHHKNCHFVNGIKMKNEIFYWQLCWWFFWRQVVMLVWIDCHHYSFHLQHNHQPEEGNWLNWNKNLVDDFMWGSKISIHCFNINTKMWSQRSHFLNMTVFPCASVKTN